MLLLMKKLLVIVVLGLLLNGCASNISEEKKQFLIGYTDTGKNFSSTKDERNEIRQMIFDSYGEMIISEERFGKKVPPKRFYGHLNYGIYTPGVDAYKKYLERIDKQKKYVSRSAVIFLDEEFDASFRGYGDTKKEAEENLALRCEKFKEKKTKFNQKEYNFVFDCPTDLITKENKKRYNKYKEYHELFLYAERKIKEKKEFEINQAKINKEIQEKDRAQKLADNKNRCEEIGFTPQTDSFAKCVLKLIELAEIRESALIESRSRASLEADMQQQQIDIQDQIAAEAKASRDQQAWGVLLGMTMGNGILDTSSGGLFSPSTVSCNKTGETTSGTNKICYYNCMGSTKTINVGSMQFCPININK